MRYLQQELEKLGTHQVPTHLIQTTLLCLLFASWNGGSFLFNENIGLHLTLERVCLWWAIAYRLEPPRMQVSANWFPNPTFALANLDQRRGVSSVSHPRCHYPDLSRTVFMAFCCLIQMRTLYNIPTSLSISDLSFNLPCSEEEWSAETGENWFLLKTSGSSPPTPLAQNAFEQLFQGDNSATPRYSEYGGYIMIVAILSAILDKNKILKIPTAIVDFSSIDMALDTWQRVWQADPKSRPTGPTSSMGAMAFNAAAIYRVAAIRRVKDYSRCTYHNLESH